MDASQPKDDSRPPFPRPNCCIGVYIDAIDARPDRNTTVGSHHAFMMAVMDRIQEYLGGLDLSKVKGALETRRIAEGAVVDGIKHNCIISLAFDEVKSLEELWALHNKNRLSALFQDILVDKALLKFTHCSKLSLRAKLWEDEVNECRHELKVRANTRVSLQSHADGLSMVRRVSAFQGGMPEVVGRSRDLESQFEQNLGEFMLTVKQILPNSTQTIKNLKEFQTNVKMAKGLKKVQFKSIDFYLQSLDYFRKVFQDAEREIVHPLCQVQAVCENEKQRNLKATMKKACYEMIAHLAAEADLQKIRHKEWENKVLLREQGLFYGMISLVPMSVDRLTTIDYSADEYINDFPECNTILKEPV